MRTTLWMASIISLVQLISINVTSASGLKIVFPTANPNFGDLSNPIETKRILTMISEISKAAKIEVQFDYRPLASIYSVDPNDIDVCVTDTPKALVQLTKFVWVGKLWSAPMILAARPGIDRVFTNLNEARGYRIGVVSNSLGAKLLEGKGVTVDAVSHANLNYKKLLAGRLDFWFSNQRSFAEIVAVEGGAQLRLAYKSEPQEFGLACSVNTKPELIERLRRAVNIVAEK